MKKESPKKYRVAKHWSKSMLGYLGIKDRSRSGVLLSQYAANKAKKKGLKDGQLVEENETYRIYYFSTEEAYDKWWKKGPRK